MNRHIKYAMLMPENINFPKDELDYLSQVKPVLRDEVYNTCYEYSESKGLLDEYKKYRG